MKKLFYICHSLPNSMTSGSDFVAFNMLKALKKKYKIHAISLGTNYCKKEELFKIYKQLKKEKIKFYENKRKTLFGYDYITLRNFFNKNYINYNDISFASNFLKKIKISKDDIILAFGSSSIEASKDINCFKIALFEDIQDQVQIYRTFFSINKFNFLKKTLKIIMLKIHFRGYVSWLKKISKNYQLKYTFSSYDFLYLNKKIDLKILPLPVNSPQKFKKKLIKKKFSISMFSTIISQDYKGVSMLFSNLLPKLKSENLLNKVKLNLIMRVPKNLPPEIKKILDNEHIHLHKYNEKIIKDTDMLFYPSKYPVGIRTKILFAITKSWFVATSLDIKKCIPELEDFKNCIMSNNINILSNKIILIIKNKKKYQFLRKNAFNILKRYSLKNFYKILMTDINLNKTKNSKK